MGNDMSNEELINKILTNQKNNAVIIMTVDGLMGSSVDDLLNQPAEGVLYDLNRDYASLMALANKGKNQRWINDMALSFTFTKLYEKYNEVIKMTESLEKTIKELKDNNTNLNMYVAELEEYIDKLNVKPVEEKITTDLNKQPVHTPINSSAKTTSVFQPVAGTFSI